MDRFAVYPWADIPLCERVCWTSPAVKVVTPHVVEPDFDRFVKAGMGELDFERATVTLEGRLMMQPRPKCPPYEWIFYVAGDEELERVMRRLALVGMAVSLLHWICDVTAERA